MFVKQSGVDSFDCVAVSALDLFLVSDHIGCIAGRIPSARQKFHETASDRPSSSGVWDNASVTQSDGQGSVIVTIDGQPWKLVPSLCDSGPGDRVFTVTQTADGGTLVGFGDGVHGAQPPAGSTMSVTYRTGGGAGGNVVTVNFERKANDPTVDQTLWVAIRNRTRAISFNSYRE